jgi:hypothetical protein
VTINGAAIGEARERDSRGRPLPSWQGCRVVREDEVFLMNPRSEDSSTRATSPHPIDVSASSGERQLRMSIPPLARAAQSFRSIATAICAAAIMFGATVEWLRAR